MTSRRHSVRPIIVEVKPDNIPRPSILSPSTPPASPPTNTSNKAVRFATTSNQFSRPLTPTEAWSLYHFENHARQCPDCYNPAEIYRRGARLCHVGHGLARDVAYHVYHRDGDIYSTQREADAKLVRVEIPHAYSQLRSLLTAMDRRLRSAAPILSYDRTYPVSARRSYTPDAQPESVIIEPAVSNTHRRPRSSKHKSVRYSTVVIDDDDDDDDGNDTTHDEDPLEDVTTVKSSERHGTLYERDMQRRKTDYRVEIREPSERKERRRKGDERRNSVWL